LEEMLLIAHGDEQGGVFWETGIDHAAMWPPVRDASFFSPEDGM
jgi:hypothetical protein